MQFQSTSSIQRKTSGGWSGQMKARFQSTSSIQRKTPRPKVQVMSDLFQSTSSIQRKTHELGLDLYKYNISIHFLYTEEDNTFTRKTGPTLYFNPLPLYRGRPCLITGHSVYRAISIHFLYTEEDIMADK